MSQAAFAAVPEERIPLVVCIDVEPDEPVPTEALPWRGFEAAVEWVKPIRAAASALTNEPVGVGWFLRMDHQIERVYGSTHWLPDNHGPALDELVNAGDELGIHPHAWRWSDGKGWVADIADTGWVAQVTGEAFAAYAAAFGRPCRAHRYGDGFVSDALLAQIHALGACVDLTAEPGMTLVAASRRGPTFVGAVPYSESAKRTATLVGANERQLVAIPLTAVDPDAILPLWHRFGRRIRYPNQARHRQLILSQELPPGVFWNLIERDLDAGELSVLAFAIRSGTFVSAADAGSIADKLHGLADHPLSARVRLATPTEAAAYVTRRARTA